MLTLRVSKIPNGHDPMSQVTKRTFVSMDSQRGEKSKLFGHLVWRSPTPFSWAQPELPHLRRPGYLGNVEEPQQVCHGCGDAGAGCPHHSNGRGDVLWAVAELIKVQRIDFVLGHKTQGGLQGFRNGVASVEYPVSQRHVGKESWAAVYFLYGKYHGL